VRSRVCARVPRWREGEGGGFVINRDPCPCSVLRAPCSVLRNRDRDRQIVVIMIEGKGTY
jgi:hypothetical protein